MISVMSPGRCLVDIPACGRHVFDEAMVVHKVWAGLRVLL